MVVNFMPHQVDAIARLGNGKILHGGVGSGKTLTVLGYYMEKEAPRDIYVITTARKRDELDWEKEAAKFGINTDFAGPKQGKIKIDSWNNIGNYIGIEDAFFIFDEQRLVGLGAWTKAFQKIAKKNRWVMLSATPGDTWTDYIPVFIANNLYKNATEFKREHLVYASYYTRYPKIVGYMNVATLEKYRNMLLVEMPYLRHTKRHLVQVHCQHDEELFKEVSVQRWNPYEDKPIQDIGEMFRLMRKVTNTDPSRTRALRQLMKKHPRLIVFYNFDYELEILREFGKDTGVTTAEWNGHRKNPVPETAEWLYLVQYVAGAEAWNCTATDAMVFYSLTYSYKNFEQAQGRIDRLDTPFVDLWYYIFLAKSVIDRAVLNSLDGKQLFNERDWAQKTVGFGENWK